MMKPSMWSQYLHGQSTEEMVRTFAVKGWRNLELSTEHGIILLERGEPGKIGREFAAFAANEGVAFPQGHLWLQADIAGKEPEQTLATLKRWLDLFVAVGVRAAVLHPGGKALAKEGVAEGKIAELRTRSLRTLADHVRGTGLFICLENGTNGTTAQALVDIIKHAERDNLAICLDTGHLNIGRGDQALFIRTAGPLLKALHIADNEGASDQHLMPYGRGNVPWDVVKRELKALAYDGLYNFEIPGENKCPIEVRLAKLDYLKTILPVLMGE